MVEDQKDLCKSITFKVSRTEDVSNILTVRRWVSLVNGTVQCENCAGADLESFPKRALQVEPTVSLQSYLAETSY